MRRDHPIEHRQDRGIVDNPSGGGIGAACVNKVSEAAFLFGHLLYRLRHKPRAAAPMIGGDPVNLGQCVSIDAGGNDGVFAHALFVPVVYS